ncbi:MAG: ATP-binding protein [Gammaproteobacteria bacterium]|nr:ATP-binding protein [Gammaproteobacteria bacterium]
MSKSHEVLAVGRAQGAQPPSKAKDVERLGRAVPEGDLRKILDALTTSEERYRTLVHSSPYCIHEIDAAGLISSMNPAGLRMSKFESESQAIGLRYLDFVGEPDGNAIAALMSEAYLGRSSEFEFSTWDGEFYQSTFVPIRGKDGSVVSLMGLSINITKRKLEEHERLRLVEALKQKEAHKAESLRLMAGAIAHSFNNELTVLLGYLDLARRQLPGGSSGSEYVSQAIRSGERSAEMSKLLLVYVGGAHRTHEPVAVDDLLDSCRESLMTLARGRATLHILCPAQSVTLQGDRSQLEQLLVALVTNAVEAIGPPDQHQGEDTGRVELVAEVTDVQTEDLARTSEPEAMPGRYLRISISDNGCGIESECQEKLFDPFYTTKHLGRGLGLPVSLGIVRELGGAIGVTSVIDEGTTVEVYLPVEGGD